MIFFLMVALVSLLPVQIDSKQQRIQKLESAMSSIRQVYMEEASRIAATTKVEEWYATIAGWPEAAESELVDDFPIDPLTLTKKGDLTLSNRIEANRYGMAPRDSLMVKSDEGHSAIRLDGKQPLRFPMNRPLSWTDSFSLCIEMKMPREYKFATLFDHADRDRDKDQRGIESWIEDGRLLCSFEGAGPDNKIRVRTKSKLPIQRWIHLAFVYGGTRSAADVQCYVDGDRYLLDIVHDNLRSDFQIDPSNLLNCGSGTRGGLSDTLIDHFQIYSTALTHVEVAALATDLPFVTWGELTLEERRMWAEHYVQRIDAQCRYHLESFHHYFRSLSENVQSIDAVVR